MQSEKKKVERSGAATLSVLDHRGEDKGSYERLLAMSTLDYIIRMLGELRTMSRGLDDGTMAYLIEMAAIEGHDLREKLERQEQGRTE